MRLLESLKKEIGEDKDGELVPKIENVDLAKFIVMRFITHINKHLIYYLLLCQANNLVS